MIATALACVIFAQDGDAVQADVAEALRLARSSRSREYFLGRQRLLELGAAAVPRLVERLREIGDRAPEPQERYIICDVLGELRQNRDDVVEILLASLEDDETFGFSVASAAARALGQIGASQAAPRLIEILRDENRRADTALRWEAARALGLLRAHDAAPVLRELLNDPAETALKQKVQVAAISALGLLRDRDAIAQLGPMLADETLDGWSEQPVYVHVVIALERITGETKGDVVAGTDQDRQNARNAWKEWFEGPFKREETRRRMEELARAIERWSEAHEGRPPENLEALATGESPLLSRIPKDGWDRAFVYRMPGTGAPYDLISYGRDGSHGGGGDGRDLWNHDEWKTIYIRRTEEAVRAVAQAVERYMQDNEGRPPRTLQDLKVRPDPSVAPNWNGPYIAEDPVDAWGRPLKYRTFQDPGKPKFEVYCAGEDDVEESSASGDPIDALISSIPAGPPPPPETPPEQERETTPETPQSQPPDGGGE